MDFMAEFTKTAVKISRPCNHETLLLTIIITSVRFKFGAYSQELPHCTHSLLFYIHTEVCRML